MKLPPVFSRQPKGVRISGAAALVLFLGLIYLPPFREIQRLSREKTRLQADGGQTRRLVDQFYRKGGTPLPESGSIPQILEQLHDRAHQHDVEILAVTPGNPPPADSAGLAIFPVEIQLQGEYRSLGEFLGELKDSAVFGAVAVRRFRISPDGTRPPVLRADLSIEIGLRQS